MTKKKVEINILEASSVPYKKLVYVVIGARESGGWIFVRHKERLSWELPAGHIEDGEKADHAAKRELYEETGTTEAEMNVLRDYRVTVDGNTKYGRIYLARVIKRGPKPESEIGENRTSLVTPLPATYPVAHAAFMKLLDETLHSESF